ncbi:MAG: hypothetical protein IJ365_06585 [Clostridia bacterium]|nr:hypothetical protein [Clostridia bacterium]
MKKSNQNLVLNLFEHTKTEDKAKQAAADKVEKADDRKQKFEQLIKGEYKDLYSQKIKDIVSKRFKGIDELKDKLAAAQDILAILSEKYGIDEGDLDALRSKVMTDDSLISEQAQRKGIDAESYRYIRNLERQNEYLKKQMSRSKEQAQIARWYNETEAIAKEYPDFDINEEIENAKFIELIKNGVDMKTAYEVVHHADIINRIKQSTAAQAQKTAAEQMQSRDSRPVENGLSAQSPALIKTDISKLTPEQRADIARRVAMGEKITF